MTTWGHLQLSGLTEEQAPGIKEQVSVHTRGWGEDAPTPHFLTWTALLPHILPALGS